MQNQMDALSNVHQEVEAVLKGMARQQTYKSNQLMLRIVYNNGLMVEDATRKRWSVNQNYIDMFAHIYKNQAFNTIKLPKWKVELKFKGKTCTQIAVIAFEAQFCSQLQTKRTSACHFAFIFAQTPQDFQQLNNPTKGYLNRLGKQELCSVSINIHKKIKTLIVYTKKQTKPPNPVFKYDPWKPIKKEVSPIDCLTDQGLKAFEKIRHFIKADQLLDFVNKNALSEYCTEDIKKLVAKKYKKEQLEQKEQAK